MREGSTPGRMPVETMIAHHQNGFSAADERGFENSKNMQHQMAHSSAVPSRRPVTLTLSAEDYRLTNRESGSFVLGVLMVDERGIGTLPKGDDFKNFNERLCTPVVLGSVLLEKRLSFSLVLAEELRNRILKQVPSISENFCFLTKNGWPISKDQERQVPIDQIVNEQYAVILRKQFEKTRVGVIADEKEHLGFIFIELKSSLRQVRDAIGEQLKENKLLVRNEFKFIEKMGFPVTSQQENLLTVADAMTNSTLLVQTCVSSPLYEPSLAHPNTLSPPFIRPTPSRRGSPVFATLSLPPSVDETDPPRITPTLREIKEKKKSFFSRNEHKGHVASSLGLVAKPILISYVRAEAAQHALTLKEELYNLGFSVYLDVHEIKSGADWQDSLNFAVSNCEVFVPLITPMYGKTQWTNREVKLADVLNKFIIPINFMDHWPPECLAIQFASTQYIAWKPLENDHMKGIDECKYTSDYRVWDVKFVKTVSRQIATRLLAQLNMVPDYPKFAEKRYRSLAAPPPSSPQRKTVRMSGIVDDLIEMKDRQTQLVVISAHPKQLIFASEVKKMLEEMNYQVWCSTELIEGAQDGDSFGGLASAGAIMRELSTIPEGESIVRLDEIKPLASITRGPSQHKKQLARSDSNETSGYVDKRVLTRLSSQMSTTSMVSESLTPDKLDRLKKFQEKVDQAGVVIVVASEAFFKSTTSRQQAFYCEHRKKIILVKYDDSSIPALFGMLMGNDMISDPQGAQFSCALKARVKRELNPASSVTPKDATMEAKMQYLVSFMKKNLPVLESCVYVSGSSRMQNERSKEICKEIGKALAKVKNINVVTGGFYGAGDITARSFEEALQNNPRSPVTPSPTTPGPIFHILPVKDTKDFTTKATQNEEGSFEPVEYGNTLFLGDSVKERESVVARLFDICIVIEGGPGAAHEVEEFIWNDHYVIPIISTGGAAGGDFGVPYKIFETPPNVLEDDWTVLSSKEASPTEVAQAVVKIVIALKTAIANHVMKQNQDKKEKSMGKINRKRSKKSRKLTRNTRDLKAISQSKNSTEFPLVVKSESLEANDHLITDGDQTLHIPGHTNRWQKIVKYLRPTCLPAQP